MLIYIEISGERLYGTLRFTVYLGRVLVWICVVVFVFLN